MQKFRPGVLVQYSDDPSAETLTSIENILLQTIQRRVNLTDPVFALSLKNAIDARTAASVVSCARAACASPLASTLVDRDTQIQITGITLGADVFTGVTLGIVEDPNHLFYVGMIKAGVPGGLGYLRTPWYCVAGRMEPKGVHGYATYCCTDEVYTGWFRDGQRHGWGRSSVPQLHCYNGHVLYWNGKISPRKAHRQFWESDDRQVELVRRQLIESGMGCWT